MSYPQITAGIARNMQADLAAPETQDAPQLLGQGGGNLNGSANQAHLMGQAGTAGTKIALPRQNIKVGGGNYCGTV